MDDDLETLVSSVEALNAADDAVLVLTCPRFIEAETATRLREGIEYSLPGRKVLVLGDGMQLQPMGQHRQLQRIEQQLGAVLEATANIAKALGNVLEALSDGEAPAESRTLDGDVWPSGERDQSRPL